MIRFKCEQCGQKICTSDQFAGKKAKCPNCKNPIFVPKTDSLSVPKRQPTLADMSDAEIAKKLLDEKSSDGSEAAIETKRSFLSPHFDEVSLFVMSFMFIILYTMSKTMRGEFNKLVLWLCDDFRGVLSAIILVIMFTGGICFSIYHAFSTREKNIGEKAAMLFFAFLITGSTGIYAGHQMLKTAKGWLMIFPIWNIIYGAFLLIKLWIMFRTHKIDFSCISDRNATRSQITVGLISAVIIFICCQYFFKLHWAITYSICICYTVSLDKAVQSVLGCR